MIKYIERKLVISVKNVKFLYDVDIKYRKEYLEEDTNNKIEVPEEEYIFELDNEEWQYFHFGTKYGFISKDSCPEYELYDDDFYDKRIVLELLQDETGNYIYDFEFDVKMINN